MCVYMWLHVCDILACKKDISRRKVAAASNFVWLADDILLFLMEVKGNLVVDRSQWFEILIDTFISKV